VGKRTFGLLIVISDTSSILNLVAVDKFHLLRDLFAEVAALRRHLGPAEAEAIVAAES
jgi:predicted nucleic acid-binding protein